MRYFSFILSLFTFVVLVFLIFFHSFFSIKDIFFEGENFISDTAIMSRTEKVIGSSIIWWGYLGGLERDLLSVFPQLESVDVKVQYPNRISIQLQEKLVSLSFLNDGQALFMSEDGTILNKDKKANGYVENLDKILIIKGIPEIFFLGSKVEKTALKKIVTLVSLIDTYISNLTLQVDCEGVVLSNNELFIKKITLFKDDHIPIYVGTMKNLSQKLFNLNNFFKYYKNAVKSIDYVDLRVSDKVIINYE